MSAEASRPPEFVPLSKLPNFDPRAVPVVGVDVHLPAIPLSALQPPALRARFSAPPVWRPEVRDEPHFTDRQIAHASVLVPLVMRELPGGRVVYETRAYNEGHWIAPERALPAMLDAALQGYPQPAAGVRRVTTPLAP
mgnify:CR=1 FL=1